MAAFIKTILSKKSSKEKSIISNNETHSTKVIKLIFFIII